MKQIKNLNTTITTMILNTVISDQLKTKILLPMKTTKTLKIKIKIKKKKIKEITSNSLGIIINQKMNKYYKISLKNIVNI